MRSSGTWKRPISRTASHARHDTSRTTRTRNTEHGFPVCRCHSPNLRSMSTRAPCWTCDNMRCSMVHLDWTPPKQVSEEIDEYCEAMEECSTEKQRSSLDLKRQWLVMRRDDAPSASGLAGAHQCPINQRTLQPQPHLHNQLPVRRSLPPAFRPRTTRMRISALFFLSFSRFFHRFFWFFKILFFFHHLCFQCVLRFSLVFDIFSIFP